MAFNVNEITSELSRRGVLKTNKFMVSFPMPLTLQSSGKFNSITNINRVMRLYCEGTNIPGVAVLLEEIRRYGYGVNEKKPYAPSFADISLTFRGDGEGAIWFFLNAWMKSTINYESLGDFTTPSGQVGLYPGEVGYKYDQANSEGYATDVTLSVFDDSGLEVIRLVLREAYPVFVGDVPLNWASRSDYMRIPVTLTFFDWYNDSSSIIKNNNVK